MKTIKFLQNTVIPTLPEFYEALTYQLDDQLADELIRRGVAVEFIEKAKSKKSLTQSPNE